ncbi:MAG TPA: hypothetical protein VFI91_10780 [Longimicrobiaceae bacterium]|nr:hypothetical protein [Longimicrobiaceae bacterium]
MRRIFLTTSVLLFLALLPACAGNKAGDDARRQQPATTVRVDNRNWLDMNVYVVQGSRQVRLGTVTGLSTRVFEIPANLVFGVASLRFVADPIGGDASPVSQAITVEPGGQVQLIIPNN